MSRIPCDRDNRDMTTLLSLPTEILIEILIACPTTRTLQNLSKVNRRMRSIWLEHWKHIIVANYKPRISHIEQAITLTLTEAKCAESSSTTENHPNDQYHTPKTSEHTSNTAPSPVCLPRVLHNAGLASGLRDALSKDDRLQPITWQTSDPRIEMLRAYYLIRHAVLAYDHPHLRPAIISTLTTSTNAILKANEHVLFFLQRVAHVSLQNAHGFFERNPDAYHGAGVHLDRDPDKDKYREVERWRGVGTVLSKARYNQKFGIQELPDFEFEEYVDW